MQGDVLILEECCTDVKLSAEDRQELSAFLARLSKVGGEDKAGICHSVIENFGEASSIGCWWDYHDTQMFRLWPKYSGAPSFPVPSETEEDATQRYLQCCDMWVGEYGARRKELAAFLSKLVLTYGE